MVDLPKLRSFARYGIPPSIRGVRPPPASSDRRRGVANRLRLCRKSGCTFSRSSPQTEVRGVSQLSCLSGLTSATQLSQRDHQRSEQIPILPGASAFTLLQRILIRSALQSMDKSPALSTRLRSECTRYYNRRLLIYTRKRRPGQNPSQATTTQNQEEAMDIVAFTTSVENVLSAFLNRNRNIEYKTGLVQLVAPVSTSRLSARRKLLNCASHAVCMDIEDGGGHVLLLRAPHDQDWCATFNPCSPSRSSNCLPSTEDKTGTTPLSVRISFFLSLFRQFLPDLWIYFDEEGVDVRELASTWLQWYFAKELPVDVLIRLWGARPMSSTSDAEADAGSPDVYFSVEDPVELHQYVCLAIFTTCKETLEELDESEVRSFLLNLPSLDVDRVGAPICLIEQSELMVIGQLVVEANNIKHAARHLQTRGERAVEF